MIAVLLGRFAPWLIAGAVVLLLGTTAWAYREQAASMQAERDEALNRALRAELSIRKQAEQAARDATLIADVTKEAERRETDLARVQQRIAQMAQSRACAASPGMRDLLGWMRGQVQRPAGGQDRGDATARPKLLSPGA